MTRVTYVSIQQKCIGFGVFYDVLSYDNFLTSNSLCKRKLSWNKILKKILFYMYISTFMSEFQIIRLHCVQFLISIQVKGFTLVKII